MTALKFSEIEIAPKVKFFVLLKCTLKKKICAVSRTMQPLPPFSKETLTRSTGLLQSDL